MAFQDISRAAVDLALRRFDLLGRDRVLELYGGGRSTRWYIRHQGKHYDQKLVLRAAHELSGLGDLPPGPGTFTAGDARKLLNRLGFKVVDPTTN